MPPTTAPAWPHDATDRVHALMGQVAQKELERMRLAEALRLIMTTDTAINLVKQRRDLGAGTQARLVAAAVAEKNKALEHAAALLRSMGL